MKRRTAGRVAKPRICAYCQSPLAERRPVYLLATTAGTIVGPYHAGCAERVVLSRRKGDAVVKVEGDPYGMLLPHAREETLPW